jgi:type 2 lantibiotic biosynthesis protein LanM
MNRFLDSLATRAATIDELLSADFEALTGQKGDTDAAGRRLAAWCRAAASGDWDLFGRRLERDGLSFAKVLARLATVRRVPGSPPPRWLTDAEWIAAALATEATEATNCRGGADQPVAFEELFAAVAHAAEERLWSDVPGAAAGNFVETGRRSLRGTLLAQLSGLCSAALYERFQAARKASEAGSASASEGGYRRFVDRMRAGGWQQLFEQKPVLLRLVATIVRQWLTVTRELIERLDSDLPDIRRDLLQTATAGRVASIEGELSDPHNEGHSVQILVFEDGRRLVYKPKDLQLDAAWQAMVGRLNEAGPPVDLRPVRVLARAGYGWTEFIGHRECADRSGFDLFFRRAGAWLALFHAFASTDMHDENMIADGDHPVPIDLEMILQATAPEYESELPERRAFDLAARRISESVMTTGLLPSYGRSPENKVYGLGGLLARAGSGRTQEWADTNSDTMRRTMREHAVEALNNLPYFGGEKALLGDHIPALLEGYGDYARFLIGLRSTAPGLRLFDGFVGLAVRKVVRPTRFYYLLTQRLRDHRSMDDGITWSAQADFGARLADWNKAQDPLWPLQEAERKALVALNVPHFVSPTDEDKIASANGRAIQTSAVPGLVRARARFARLDEDDVTWQTEVIRQSTAAVSRTSGARFGTAQPNAARPSGLRTDREAFLAEATIVFEHISALAIRSGPGAAWLGLDWLGDSEVSQLVPLGYDLYNGSLGIAVFLAAHAKVTAEARARELAVAAIASLSKDLRGATAARLARGLGVGAASGLGSVVYGLTTIAQLLGDEDVLADAGVAAGLFTTDLIAADKALDIIGGSAGGILGLLRFYRATESADALARAIQCGDHLLAQRKLGNGDLKCWAGEGLDRKPLNGMSHGAAGFAYALASLSAASGQARFAEAASDCIAFENSSFSEEHSNWPDMRAIAVAIESGWPCQWCHGATGIGLARLGTLNAGNGANAGPLRKDVERALSCVKASWPGAVDTLCCGTLGSVEFLEAAGRAYDVDALRDLAAERLAEVVARAAMRGDYGFAGSGRQFNLGLFRGMAGIGYTLLRRTDRSLPNVLLWE